MKRAAICGAVAVLAGCSAVKQVRLRDDYAQVDQTRTKRLVVVTAPLPDGNEKVGALWSLIAQRYANLHRDFLVKKGATAGAPLSDVKASCVEGIEGVLWLKPEVKRAGGGVEAAVDAQLLRCSDGQEVWGAKAAGSWDSADPHLAETTEQYVAKFGEDVRPYVAPTFLLLRATLDTLPKPILTDEDVAEKIELEE
jgi:probable lipoprotein (TIGR04455 family)